MRARLYLEKNDYEKAADWFNQAAEDLCKLPLFTSMTLNANLSLAKQDFDINKYDTAEILPPDQLDKFSDGLPAYCEHIMTLLDKHKASLYTAQFAKLALDAHQKDVDKAYQVSRSGRRLRQVD